MVAVAMNIRDKTMAYERRIADIVYSMQNFIYENYNFHVVALAGEAHKGLEGIHKSYMEAKEAEEFVAALDPDLSATGKSMTGPIKNTLIPPEQGRTDYCGRKKS